MKKIALGIVMLMSVLGCHSVRADDFDMAKLKINLSGPVHNSAYFLCVSNNGCSRISAAAAGKIYYVDTGNVDFIFAASLRNYTMRSESLPKSCQVNLTKDQTLTVSGKLIVKGNSPYIEHLKCAVT